MKQRFLRFLLALTCGFAAAQASAEDIDLFVGSTTANASLAPPNLLFVMDNASNFNANAAGHTCVIDGVATSLSGKAGGVMQCAMYNALNSLPVTSTPSINIGIMVHSGTGVTPVSSSIVSTSAACSSSSTGGCLLFPIIGLTTTTKAQLLAYIKSWTNNNVGGNTKRYGATMAEAWQYYAGKTGLSGKGYSSIQPAVGCGKNYIIFIGNNFNSSGTPGDQSADGAKAALEGTISDSNKRADPAATTAQKALITNTTANSVTTCGSVNMPATNNHENAGFYADEWARYMRQTTYKIKTYTIGLKGDGCKAENAWLLNSVATVGGGKYFETSNTSEMQTALQTIFSEVRSVNSVFAAVSLPVSVNSQGTYLNQVFVGMFRPDPDANPRWNGNLKQYKMGFLNGNFRMLDQDGAAAISSSGSEFVAECARSYWTPAATTTGDGYFTNYADANCTGYPATSNSPDGNVVEKGGQGYMTRATSPSTRVVKTCSPTFSSCTTLTDFNTSNSDITWGRLGMSNSSGFSNVVNWARGQNTGTPFESNVPEGGSLNGSALTSTDMRPSVHGDVVHSRPAAINFGTDASPKVVVFYAGNDGVLRAINGNRSAAFTANSSTVNPGAEFWAFIPPEFWSNYNRLYNNSPIISTTNKKSYGLDGPITAYRNGADAWIYVPMRRGGRALYAFHVNGSTLAITLKWKIGCGDTGTSNCSSTSLETIGQTWAPPQVFTAQNPGSTTPLLIMGGGYDTTCEDATSCTSTSTGNKIYVLNADTGALLKTFTTNRGVIADVTITKDSASFAEYIYAVDMGGTIYRIAGPASGNITAKIGNNDPSTWTITTVANLGCDTGTTCTSPPNRKFMQAPDVVIDGTKYVVLVGSGNRENPTNTSNTTTNYFYRVDDRPDLSTTAYLNDTNCSVTTALCSASLVTITLGSTPDQATLDAAKGWKLQMRTNEQVTTAALTIFGTVFFTSHEPIDAVSGSCSVNLGTLRNYAVSYTNAAATSSTGEQYTERTDGGLSPEAVAGQVILDNGTQVPFCIGCVSPLEASQPPVPTTTSNPAKIRSYWYIEK